MSHVTRVNESCDTYAPERCLVKSDVTRVNELCHREARVNEPCQSHM